MPKKKASGKKRIRNTTFGRRAIAGARSGKGGIANPDGTRSSVKTATFDIPGPRGKRTDVMLAPTIRKVGGKLVRLSGREAGRIAADTGDFVRVRGGTTQKQVERARAKGDNKSRRFSAKLGRISARKERRDAQEAPRKPPSRKRPGKR